MAVIFLPPLPRATQYSPRPVRGGSSILRPAFGGPRQPLGRMGDHWLIEVEAGVLPPGWGYSLLADLMRGASTRVALPFPEGGISAGTPGAPVVSTSGQSGETLLLSGFTPHYAVRKGKFFSLITAGQRYLYMATDYAIAAADGTLSLPIWPMLRVPHLAGDVAEFASPMIEGLIDEPVGWSQGLIKAVTVGRFILEEVE